MLALPQHQHQLQQHKLRSKSLHGSQYGAQTVARSRNIAASHNSRLMNSQTFQYDPDLILSMQQAQQENSPTFIYQQNLQQQQQQQYQAHESLMSAIEKQAMLNRPLCRCRVMYLGSSVPHITKNGLHGIQEPLKHLYPEEQFNSNKLILNRQQQQQATNSATGSVINNTTIDISHLSSSLGIDSWLSVWSNGLLLENVDEFGREIKRFFFIESLHYCAAVRFFDTTTLMLSEQRDSTHISSPNYNNEALQNGDLNNNTIQRNNKPQQADNNDSMLSPDNEPGEEIARQQRQRKSAIRFLPLDAPLFQCPGMLDANHPPVFASIMRRTTGIKVLECHAFICRRDAAANALVRCCTHAYADFLNAKRLSIELGQTLPYKEYSKGATISSSSSRHFRRATSVTSRMVKARNSPTYETANGLHNNHLQHQFGSTGASNEDNSLEASSEDNYAIISKHHQPRHPNQQPEAVQQETSTEKERKKGLKSESKTASTKSLYDDFMPKVGTGSRLECCATKQSRDTQEMKLSHSLDLLNQEFDQNCNINNSSDNNEATIQYAVVKNKRHSKSMQNLDGPFEFSARAARSSSRVRHGRRSRRSGAGTGHEKNRKAASYQDMLKRVSVSSDASQQHQHQQPPLPGSHLTPNCGLSDGCGQLEPPLVYHRACNELIDCDCPLVVENQAGGVARQNIRPEYVYSRARKSSSRKAREQHSLARISRKSREIQNQLHCMEQQQANLPHLALNQALIYQQPAHHFGPIYPAGAHHLAGSSTMYQMAPPAACYLNQTGAHASHYQQPVYAAPSGASIYDHQMSRIPYLPPPPPLGPHLNYAQLRHPPQPFVQSHQQPCIYGDQDLCSQTMMGPRKNQKGAKSSLARFRCLSPPVNFLTHFPNQSVQVASERNSQQFWPNSQQQPASVGDVKSKGKSSVACSESSLQQQQQQHNNVEEQVLANEVEMERNETNNASEPQQQQHQQHQQEHELDLHNVHDVVSAKPSFISSAANVREKKMSWIKRLSLTMISGSSGQVGPEELSGNNNNNNNLSVDPNGDKSVSAKAANDGGQVESQCLHVAGSTTSNMTKKKKRSGLFSGSLTLGRRKQQHAKLQITPTPTTTLAAAQAATTDPSS